MIENFGPQAVDYRLRASLLIHVFVEGLDKPGQNRLQCGPFAVELTSLDPRIELFGILEISIDEAGEDRPPEETQLEGEASLVVEPPGKIW